MVKALQVESFTERGPVVQRHPTFTNTVWRTPISSYNGHVFFAYINTAG